jgi:hypothetical protein
MRLRRGFFELVAQRDDLLPSYHSERLKDLEHAGDFTALHSVNCAAASGKIREN